MALLDAAAHLGGTPEKSFGIQQLPCVWYNLGTNSFFPLLQVIMGEPEPLINDRQQLISPLSRGHTILQQAP